MQVSGQICACYLILNTTVLIPASLVVFTLETVVKLYGQFFAFNVISKHACCLDSCREFTSSTIISHSLAYQVLLMFHFIAGRRAWSGFFALRGLKEETIFSNVRKNMTIACTLIASPIHCSGGQLVLKLSCSYSYLLYMLIAHICLL